jgi:antitoxin (DNA-binding transcriptional repressor) of toxin-antitoxin stability system
MVATRPAPSTDTAAPTFVTATQLAKNLLDTLNRVKYQGEHFVVQRDGETIATLAPPPPVKSITLGELLDALRALPPLDDGWVADMEAVLAARPVLNPEDYNPWPD